MPPITRCGFCPTVIAAMGSRASWRARATTSTVWDETLLVGEPVKTDRRLTTLRAALGFLSARPMRLS